MALLCEGNHGATAVVENDLWILLENSTRSQTESTSGVCFHVCSLGKLSRSQFDPPRLLFGSNGVLIIAAVHSRNTLTPLLGSWNRSLPRLVPLSVLHPALICLAKVCFLLRLQINFPESVVQSNLIDPI